MKSVFISLCLPTLKDILVQVKKKMRGCDIICCCPRRHVGFRIWRVICFDFDRSRVACNTDGDINKSYYFEEFFFER
jgi:hypothetical protein